MSDQWLIDIENPLIRDHRVLGQNLLPGLAYIDLLFQVFRDRGHDYRSLELRDLSIFQPLTVSKDEPVLLDIQCTETSADHWRIQVEGRVHRDGVPGIERKRYVTAEMCRVGPTDFSEAIDLSIIAADAAQALSLEDVYAKCRLAELVHKSFMKAEGRIFVSDAAIHVVCELSETARASAEHMMFHPVLIDATATCGGGATAAWQKADQEGQLDLPLFYKSFRASELLQNDCIVRI